MILATTAEFTRLSLSCKDRISGPGFPLRDFRDIVVGTPWPNATYPKVSQSLSGADVEVVDLMSQPRRCIAKDCPHRRAKKCEDSSHGSTCGLRAIKYAAVPPVGTVTLN